MSQQFSLKWHSHSVHLANSFNVLRGEDEFLTDVTLCCEGKRLRAHKIILSVCSTYFRETFMDNPCKHPVVIFKNVKFDDLTNIVEFMYKGEHNFFFNNSKSNHINIFLAGEVSISQDSLSSFLHVAEMLQVRGLSENQEIVPEKSLIATPVTQSESLFISVSISFSLNIYICMYMKKKTNNNFRFPMETRYC
jgi:BTB/POZ domain